jgi:hypothetical protein
MIITSLILEFLYTFRYYRVSFNSDSAAFNLFAIQMHTEGSLFPKEWFYANGDIFIFSPHLVMYILNYWVNDQFLIHGCGVIIFFLIFQFSLYHLIRTLQFRRDVAIIGVAVFSAITTISLREFVYGQGAYIGIFILTNWIFITSLRILNPNLSRLNIRSNQLILLVILFLFTASNPVRSIPGALVPIFAILLEKNFRSKTLIESTWKDVKKFIYPALGFLLGVLTYFFVYRMMNMENGINIAVTRDLNSTNVGLEVFVNSLGYITGIAPGPNHKQLSAGVIASFIRLIILIVSVYGIIKAIKSEKLHGRHFVVFFLAIFTPSAFLMIFSGLGIDYTAGRYVMIPVLMFLVVGLLFAYTNILATTRNFILVLCSLLLASNCYSICKAEIGVAKARDGQVMSSLNEYSNLSASYWNASKYQVLSNGSLIIQPIKWDPESCISPFAWLSTKTIVFPESRDRNLIVFPEEFANLTSPACVKSIKSIRKTPMYWIVNLNYGS